MALAAAAGVVADLVVIKQMYSSRRGLRAEVMKEVLTVTNERSWKFIDERKLETYLKSTAAKEAISGHLQNSVSAAKLGEGELFDKWRSRSSGWKESSEVRRASGAVGVTVEAEVYAHSLETAKAAAAGLQDGTRLGQELSARGLPAPSSTTVSVQDATQLSEASGVSLTVVAGVSVGGFLLIVIASLGFYVLARALFRQRWHRRMLQALRCAKVGEGSKDEQLPLELARAPSGGWWAR
jgi:hypothetical protein